MSAIGTALGPSLGGLLIAATGWRAIFLLNLPLGLAAFFLARHWLTADHNQAPGAKTSFDAVGTVLLALALSTYALAMTRCWNTADPTDSWTEYKVMQNGEDQQNANQRHLYSHNSRPRCWTGDIDAPLRQQYRTGYEQNGDGNPDDRPKPERC
jgi:hypothetical protein